MLDEIDDTIIQMASNDTIMFDNFIIPWAKLAHTISAGCSSELDLG
jgi:hypothetical protein